MAKYKTGSLVKQLRKRIGIKREIALKISKLDESNLHRIESEKQHPKAETLENLLKSIDLPMEGFYYSLLDYKSTEVYLLCDSLTQALDLHNFSLAEELLAKLEKLPYLDDGILRQFVLSKKAKLLLLQGEPSEDILSLIEKGLAETFENNNESDVDSEVLVLEEPDLYHTKACVYARDGNYDNAVYILENLFQSLAKLPSSDREKERQFAPVLLSLSECLFQKCNFERVLELCSIGSGYSATRNHGFFNPDFEMLSARAYNELGRVSECTASLKHAYFGHILRGDVDKEKSALAFARQTLNIMLETYGVEKLEKSNITRVPYSRGDVIECDSLGSMIARLRAQNNLSLSQLCSGICDKSTLSRMEKGEIPGNYFILEAIMQRLGRDISLYSNFFLASNDFIAMQLRDRIYLLITMRKFGAATKLLNELDSIASFRRYAVNKQFLETARALLFDAANDACHPDLLKMLLDTLKITIPKFDEQKIASYRLSYNELIIINLYAVYYKGTGDLERAVKIFAQLRRSMDAHYEDDFEKSRMYTTVLFNYSSTLARLNRRGEAFEVIADSEHFEKSHGRLIDLPALSYNRGYGMFMLERHKECIPHLALGYYGVSMFAEYGQSADLTIIRDSVKEKLNINFT